MLGSNSYTNVRLIQDLCICPQKVRGKLH